MRKLLLPLFLCLPLLAQTKPAPNKTAVLPPCGPEHSVRGVSTPTENPPRVFYLTDYVTVHVCNLDAFMAEAERQQQPITLYLDGVDTKNLPAGVDREAQTITFVADRKDDNKDLWRLWLYDPLHEPRQDLRVSIGRGGERPLPRVNGANMKIQLDKIYLDSFTWLMLLFLAAVVVGVIAAGRFTDMLRDGPSLGPIRQTYSLARAQMAFWFVLILLAYVFVWLVTSDRDTIPASLLGLMGISAATAVAAVAISPSTTPRAEALREGLQADIAAIDASLARIEVQRTTNPELAPLLDKRRDEQQRARNALVMRSASLTAVVPSRGFWRDLVADDRGGVTLDRVQIAVWTIVLGMIFISSVALDLTMPEFSGTLLALMGISSGTYIGFQLPQKKKDDV